jgi:hypothetical protein
VPRSSGWSDPLNRRVRSSHRIVFPPRATNKKSINSRLRAAFIFVARIGRARFLSTNADSTAVLAFSMSERQQSPYDSIAGRWLALVERRQQNFVELCNTERWRRYYTHTQFLEEMRKVLHLRDQWARLAGLPLTEQMEFQQTDWQQNIKQDARHRQESGARQVKPTSHSTVGQRRRPASAILAAVAGRV